MIGLRIGRPGDLWLDVDGARMYAATLGDGPPVVLLHGYGVSGSYMLPLARVLANSFSVYVPDLPGQGRSDPQPEATGVGGLAEALGAWIEGAGLERPPVVANSMGCQVATQLAAREQDRVGPLVLIGPTVDPARRRARHQLFGGLRDAAREPWALLARAALDDATVGPRALLSTAHDVLRDRIEDRLPQVTQRTVVVHGGRDGFVTAAWAERVAELLPRGSLVSVPGEPHAVHYTRPELVADIVEEVLVKEREHAGGELERPLEHGDVLARKQREPRVREDAPPLLGYAGGHEAIAFAPDQ